MMNEGLKPFDENLPASNASIQTDNFRDSAYDSFRQGKPERSPSQPWSDLEDLLLPLNDSIYDASQLEDGPPGLDIPILAL